VTRARVAAAVAALITALLLQATLVAPVSAPLPLSLPAVLVAMIALVDGPATGLAFGFATGLTADLGSQHPAGVLALCWLGVGLLCGLLADRHSVRRDALAAGAVCGLASVVATALLMVVHSPGSLPDAITYAVPTALGDTLIALALVPLVRRMLRTDALRAPHPVYTELAVGRPHA
jgi:cell shape-determining protein MreD